MSSNIEIRVTSRTEGVEQVGVMGAELRKLGGEAAETAAKLNKIDAYTRLKTELSESEAVMKRIQAEALALGQAMAHTEKPTAEMRRELNRALTEAERAEKAFFANQHQLGSLRTELQHAGVNTGRLAGEQRTLVTQRDRTQKQRDGDEIMHLPYPIG